MKNNLKYLFIIVAIIILLIFIYFATAFGFFEYLKKGTNQNIIKTNNIVLEIDDNSSLEITNENSYPLTDEMGRNVSPYTFKLNNLGGAVAYKLKLIKDTDAIASDGCSDNLIANNSLRYQLIKDGVIVGENLLSNLTDNIIDSTSIETKATSTYQLRVWIDKSAGIEVMNKHYHGKIMVVVGE